ncbi:MAG: hypothetical protein WCD42_08510 [Rhizomicrobium sp.]
MLQWRIKIVLALIAGLLTAPAMAEPFLHLNLKPHSSNGAVDYIDVTLCIEHPDLKAEDIALAMALEVASVPAMHYDGDALTASDSKGTLPLTYKDSAFAPSVTGRRWYTARGSVGDVTYHYRALPRAISAATHPAPLFDLHAEGAGLNGAGLTFLALPQTDISYHISLHWDLSAMPKASRGVWSFGEGDTSKNAPADVLANSFYAAGPLNSYPATGAGHFGMYWLGTPSFDVAKIGGFIDALYAYMAKYFDDENESYRIIIRKNPYRGSNGTALTKSFMFSYSDGIALTDLGLKELLAHEMTHNWPELSGSHGDISWYSEGTAEYYSLILSYRAGLLSAGDFLTIFNDRAAAYYTNPLQQLTNREAAKLYWQETLAQRVPYGRGLLYLAAVDAKIRNKSGDKDSLDSIVKTLSKRDRTGQSYDIATWRNMIAAKLGPDALQDDDDMVAGKAIIPPPGMLGPCFSARPTPLPVFELGFSENSLHGDKKIISGLVPGSAAEKAGLRNGDEVLQFSNVSDLLFHWHQHMQMTVRRAGKDITIDYAPHGASVPGYQWVRNAEVPDSACKL